MAAEPAGGRRPFLARRLADSPELRGRIEAAERLGISLKRFDGWEPTEVTEFEYDPTGRLVRSVTTREPEWDEHQQSQVLALEHMRVMVCPGCGGWLPETTTVEAEGYRVPPPLRCGQCTAISIAQDRHAKDHSHMHATRWSAERRG